MVIYKQWGHFHFRPFSCRKLRSNTFKLMTSSQNITNYRRRRLSRWIGWIPESTRGSFSTTPWFRSGLKWPLYGFHIQMFKYSHQFTSLICVLVLFILLYWRLFVFNINVCYYPSLSARPIMLNMQSIFRISFVIYAELWPFISFYV